MTTERGNPRAPRRRWCTAPREMPCVPSAGRRRRAAGAGTDVLGHGPEETSGQSGRARRSPSTGSSVLRVGSMSSCLWRAPASTGVGGVSRRLAGCRRSRRRRRDRSEAGMAADLPPQDVGDLDGESATTGASMRQGSMAAGSTRARSGRGGRTGAARAAEPHRLAHVVGDEDDRRPGLPPDPRQLVVQQVAGDGVERGERLVHEQDAEPWASARARATRCRMPPESSCGACDGPRAGRAQQLLAPGLALALGHAAELQGELDVLPAVSHGKSAASWNMRAARPRSRRCPRLRRARRQVQQRRLAAARRAEQADELAGRVEVDPVEDAGRGRERLITSSIRRRSRPTRCVGDRIARLVSVMSSLLSW